MCRTEEGDVLPLSQTPVPVPVLRGPEVETKADVSVVDPSTASLTDESVKGQVLAVQRLLTSYGYTVGEVDGRGVVIQVVRGLSSVALLTCREKVVDLVQATG